MNNTMTAVHDSRMVLTDQQGKIVFDRTTTNPQLDHSERLAFDRDARLYCGGERGQIFPLPPRSLLGTS
ncbi:MAG: hypothetical protein P0120_14075 [Nitrospira sp.]|nr:hypothetical protein [Nitrospira sp.]